MMQLTKTRALAVLALVPMLLLGLMSAAPTHAARAATQGFLLVQTTDAVTGDVVSSALVTITTPASPYPIAQGKTDASGSFNVALTAGTYRVAVTAANYRPFAQTIVIAPNQPIPVTHMAASLDPVVSGPVPVPVPTCCVDPGD
jgi:hypothetical protein